MGAKLLSSSLRCCIDCCYNSSLASWHKSTIHRTSLKKIFAAPSSLNPLFFGPLSSHKNLHFHCFAKFLKVLQFNVQQAAMHGVDIASDMKKLIFFATAKQ